jgi:hypothetical protein
LVLFSLCCRRFNISFIGRQTEVVRQEVKLQRANELMVAKRNFRDGLLEPQRYLAAAGRRDEGVERFLALLTNDFVADPNAKFPYGLGSRFWHSFWYDQALENLELKRIVPPGFAKRATGKFELLARALTRHFAPEIPDEKISWRSGFL